MSKIFKMDITVGAESIDVMKHTNNKVYLQWMEEAALEHSAYLGWTMERYFEVGGAFIARAHWIEYLRPTFEGDKLTMYTWVENLHGRTSLRRFVLARANKVCMRGATEWAFIDMKTGRAVPIFEEIAKDFPIVPLDDPELEDLPFKVGPVGKLPE